MIQHPPETETKKFGQLIQMTQAKTHQFSSDKSNGINFSLNSFPVLEAEYFWWVLQRFYWAAQTPGGPFQLTISWDGLKYQPLGSSTRRKNRSRCPAQKDTWSCRSSPEAEKELAKLMRSEIHLHSSRKPRGPPCELEKHWIEQEEPRTGNNSTAVIHQRGRSSFRKSLVNPRFFPNIYLITPSLYCLF